MDFEGVLKLAQQAALHDTQCSIPESWGREAREEYYRGRVVREYIDRISRIPWVGVVEIPESL